MLRLFVIRKCTLAIILWQVSHDQIDIGESGGENRRRHLWVIQIGSTLMGAFRAMPIPTRRMC